MKQQTINIRKSIHQYEDQVDRIKHLKDSYKDDIAYIITAGPTLKNHDIELLNDKLFLKFGWIYHFNGIPGKETGSVS